MHIRALSIVSLLLASLLVPVSTAHAQSPLASDTWILTPFAGVALDSDADASLTIGGALAFPLTPTLAVEGELGHLFDMAPDDAAVDSALTTVHGSLLYFFESSFVAVPYVAAGIGIGKFSLEVDAPPASFDRTEVGFNLGGGVVYPLSGPAWFRGDFRFFKHIDNVPTVWRLTAGITLRIGN